MEQFRKHEVYEKVKEDLRVKCKHCKQPKRAKKDEYCVKCRGGIMRVGKHRGKTFRKIFDTDLSYCRWVMREKRFGDLSVFKWWLRENCLKK